MTRNQRRSTSPLLSIAVALSALLLTGLRPAAASASLPLVAVAPLAQIVAEAPTPDGHGAWVAYDNGLVVVRGDAKFYGDLDRIPLNRPVVSIVSSGDGRGYWLSAADGGVFSFGDARFYGSLVGRRSVSPVVAMQPTPDRQGYWLIASGGRLYPFGDARRYPPPSIGVRSRVVGMTVITAPSGPVAGRTLPIGSDPANRPPSAAVTQYCTAPTSFDEDACNSAALSDIDVDRAQEGLGPLPIPSDLLQLSVGQQIIEITNAERTSRGLPALGENVHLDADAQAGAIAGVDPTGPRSVEWGSNGSWGWTTPLAADIGWMYDDGQGGDNSDCTASNAAGCWGHRASLLSRWSTQTGVGVAVRNGVFVELTQLFAGRS